MLRAPRRHVFQDRNQVAAFFCQRIFLVFLFKNADGFEFRKAHRKRARIDSRLVLHFAKTRTTLRNGKNQFRRPLVAEDLGRVFDADFIS